MSVGELRACVLAALALAACGDETADSAPRPLSSQQQQAVSKLVDGLMVPELSAPEAALGFANQLFAVGFVLSIPPGKLDASAPGERAGALGEECVTESGNITYTYACPGVTGTVTVTGDTFDIDLRLTEGLLQGGFQSLHMIGQIHLGEGYSSGRLYMEVATPNGSAAMTVDYEAWTAGSSSRGWMTYTWSDPQIFGSDYQLVRVVWDGDSFTYTYE